VFEELDPRRNGRLDCVSRVTGLVALTVGCLAISAYMGRDLTGGAVSPLSVDAVICLIGLNSASPEGRPLRITSFIAGLARREGPTWPQRQHTTEESHHEHVQDLR
jgi:hypothetical protein